MLFRSLGRAGHGDEALTNLETACADLDDIDDPALVGRAFDHLAVRQCAAGSHEQSLITMRRAFAAIGVLRDENALAPLHIHRAGILREVGRAGEGLADTAAAMRIANATNDAYALSVALWVAANLREDIGDMEGALADRDAELALLQELGNQRNTAGAEAARARILNSLGRTEEARQAADHARAAAESCCDAVLAAAIDRDLQALEAATD